ncbi:hypothetical protein Sipo8835_00105 [Streptomyces ipomoeae]|uniref:DUF3040 domain-containing protein n=1 Tax=Streptomyces ipomoeae TaxID=103232 RepID=A0AAE8W7Y4_9ACTN|nr:hypothetical protein [Streptomyces ipomoeae]TQE40248.1 hypothetical protein Sipo8835_00105 [Streptomyces ipomoeae]
MNDEISKAARDAVEAEANSEQLKLIAAVLQAQQLLNAQQQTSVVQQSTQPFDTKKWLVIGGVVISGGLVASLFAIAVAIGAVSVAILALVVRGMWADYQRHR